MTPVQLYDGIKYWLPIFGLFGIIIRAYTTAKKNVSGWADTLLNNHLSHIEAATTSTEVETKKTNALLIDHQEKHMQVWQGVVKTLAILEDRTNRPSRSPRRRS